MPSVAVSASIVLLVRIVCCVNCNIGMVSVLFDNIVARYSDLRHVAVS